MTGWNTGFLIALSDVCASHLGESLLATAVPGLSPSQSERSVKGTYFGLQDFHFKILSKCHQGQPKING